MKLKRILATVLALAMVLSMMSFSVFATASTITVSNSDELIAALADEDANVTITMLNDITVEAGLSNAYGKTGINILYGQTLDGNGYTLTVEGANGTWDSAISTTGGTIKNLTIDSGFRGVFVNHNSTYSASVVLENVVIDGPTYTISCDQATNNGLIATNSTFNGWTSYAATIGEVKFINCNFGYGAGYAFCRPYAATTFDACDFNGEYAADPRAETTMTYCKLNGELITSENIGDLCVANSDKATANDKAIADKVAYIPGVGGFDTLEAALKALKENSVLEILSDVTIDYKWDNRNTGAKIKVPVTINGNGKTIKFTNVVNDGYNYLSAFRFEAAATVNNLTIDMSEAISEFNGRFRAISAKSDLTVDSCNFIGSTAYNNTRAIIFGEGAEDAIGDVEVNISDSTFTNWRRGVSDNENKQDAKSVAVTDSLFTNASINVSASEEVTITGNEIDGSYFNVTSYTQPNELAVTVNENILDEEYADYNVIQAGKTIDAQEDVVMPKVTLISNGEASYHYNKFDDALTNAEAGDTIDLNGNTIDFIQANVGKALKIANGTITMSPATVTFAAETPAAYWFVSNDITFENITFTGENYNTAGWGVFYLTKTDASVNFVNSTINLKNDISSGGGFIKGDVADVSASFDNTDVYLENTKRGFNNLASLTLSNDSDFVLKGTAEKGMENAINKAGEVTINDTSSIEIDGCFEYGIKMDNDVHVNDNAKVVVRNSGIADIMERDNVGNPALRVNDDATVIADIITPEVWAVTQGNGEVIEKSENIFVQFKKVDIEDKEDTVEGSDKYEIILSGYKHNINRLTTADLTFKLDANPYANTSMAYIIESKAGITLTPHDADGYMFNFDGVTSPDETGENIVIGYVTISGYGNYTFSVAADDAEKGIKNIVNATEVQDSIVDTFIIDGATDKGTLIINTSINNEDSMVGMIENIDIAIPTKTLTINIDFPNEVIDQAKVYQDMKVEITGNIDGVNKTVEYKLGTDGYKMENGSYVVTEDRLVLNNAYTVTVSGAGYRTARYTVTMTKDKTINFWNNVMDNETVVEEDKHSEKKNFLAGDIVKDNNINIYDLSAVVSYFGTQTVENGNILEAKYAKYDLNRDGVIDSKDVAYVLVSWGE